METLENVVTAVRVFVWEAGIPVGDSTIPIVVIALIGAGAFLTLRLGFIQLRHFGHGVAVATGRYDDPDSTGDVSHFQALSTRFRPQSASATLPASRWLFTGEAPVLWSGCG